MAHLEILAKLYILRYQYADAAAVYETLAVRKQGLGDEAVDLSDRVEMYRSAVLQVRALIFPGTSFGLMQPWQPCNRPCRRPINSPSHERTKPQ